MTLQAEIIKDIRRGILRMLRQVTGHTLNDNILYRELVNHHNKITHAQVRDHLRYLEGKGYVELENVEAMDILFARITPQGIDVLDGMTEDPGVAGP